MSINLDNFECHSVSKSEPCILTSPRSLRACSRLLIQPEDLVYKSLEEYEETLCDIPLSQIYKIYEDNETERQEKLLRCRLIRKEIISEDNFKKLNKFDEKCSKDLNALNKTKSYSYNNLSKSNHNPGNGSEYDSRRCDSDTESFEDYWYNDNGGKPASICSARNFPDLTTLTSSTTRQLRERKSNLNFDKIVKSPRPYCPCNYAVDDSSIYAEYMKRYGHLLSSSDLSKDDKKILELLIRRKGRDLEWDKKSQALRQAIENDKMSQIQKSNLYYQKLHDQLLEKRRLENYENRHRFMELQKIAQQKRDGLLQYIETRDLRIKNYLDQLDYEKRKRLLDKQKQEAIRQLEVGKTIERLLEADRLHRAELNHKLNQRMINAEIRKKRCEKDNWRHIAEMNRLEEIKRSLQQEKLEQEYHKSIESLRHDIEEKEHRANLNYLTKLHARNTLLKHGDKSRVDQSVERARCLHAQLLQGLQDWNQKVFEIHQISQERAAQNYRHEMNRRKARIVSDRLLRESRSSEILRRVRETEERRQELFKSVIQSKECKSAKILSEKERQYHMGRLRAQHASEIRQTLREKLDPETFDRKAQRAELEMKFIRIGHGSRKSAKEERKKINTTNVKFPSNSNILGSGINYGSCKSSNNEKSSNNWKSILKSSSNNNRIRHSHCHCKCGPKFLM